MAQLAMMMDGAYPHDKARWEVWYECPQNGTHKSRGGVQFGAGLLTGMLQSFWALHGGIRRGKAHGVFPGPHKRAGSWRGYVLGDRKPPEDWKKWAIREVRERFGVVPRSDDEAEAILIAWYGSNQRL